ncbi:MAG: VanZ family protein, partial [Pirellulales bacterium]|nr:VanZ family protein [Pirellulales bacterium]
MTSSTKLFGIGACLWALLLAFGSWAPLQVREVIPDDAWSQFLQAGQKRVSRSDWTVNVLIGIPLALTLAAFFHAQTGSAGRRISLTLLSLTLSSLWSLICEWGQFWFDGRVGSILDWIAQTLGGLAAVLLWQLVGQRCLAQVDSVFSASRPANRLESLVTISAVGALLWSILPGDFLVSPADWARKWSNHGMELIPFTRWEASLAESFFQWFASAVIALPLGLLAGIRLLRHFGAPISIATVVLTAILVGTLPELIQIPLASRVASSTDALFGILGSMFGIQTVLWMKGQHEDAPSQQLLAWSRDPALWFVTAIVFATLMCLMAWYPFQFETDLRGIRSQLEALLANPFGDRGGADLPGIFHHFRAMMMSAGLGALCGLGVANTSSNRLRKILTPLAIGCLTLFCLGLELGQFLEATRVGGGVGSTLRSLAAWLGFGLAQTLAKRVADPTIDNPSTSKSIRQISPWQLSPAPPPRSETAAGSAQYIPGLNGLRAIACLAVFAVHWQQLTGFEASWGSFDAARLLSNGNTGVAIFLVLTGFLLSTRLWAEPESTRPSQARRHYWRRRAIRILPTYWLCLAALLVITGQWRSAGGWLDTGLHAVFLHN